jgi:phosphomannomutase
MTAYSKQLIIFDLDGTLTVSKSPMASDVAELIVNLLERKKVAIISGGAFPQFQTEFLAMLPGSTENYSNLYLLPTSGTRLYTWKGDWTQQYAENLSPADKDKIMAALNYALKSANYVKPEVTYGPLIEDRGSQITFSALGQKAPVDQKYAWDPTNARRELIVSVLHDKIPEFDARIGGATSVDITRKGVNKAYGIHKLEEYLKIPIDQMVFIGDKLMYGGNDYPAKSTGVDCIQVSGPDEAKKLIESWLV